MIQRQLDAFLRDDASAAFACQTQAARNRFRTPVAFLERIKRRFPTLYRPKRIAFDAVIDVQGQVAQQLLVQGNQGVPMLAIFVMALEADGHWRIDACLLYELAAPRDDSGSPLLS